MQELESKLTQINSNLQPILEDIVHKIEIKSDFSICHPDYKPLEIPEEARESFEKMPSEIKHKYLNAELRGFLYGIYYNGSLKDVLDPNQEEQDLPQDLENNTILGIDVNFYEQLDKSNKSSGYFDSGWQILREEKDGSVVVTKGGLKLYIDRDKHLSAKEKQAIIDDIIKIKLPKNRVQNGFYMAVGNQGFSHTVETGIKDTTVRIYFNFTPDGAISVMNGLTQELNQLEIPFSFKVLYNPKEYKRHDSGVLYFDKQNYPQVKDVLTEIYHQTKEHFKSGVPLFTLKLEEGLGLAEEPNHRFSEQESFGTHRCQIIANGLLNAFSAGNNSPEVRMQAIIEEFDKLGIPLERIYLNANSEDIYQY